MTIQDQRRKGFEAFMRKQHPHDVEMYGASLFAANGEGYAWVWVTKRFELWNAALDSVVIELPKVIRGGRWGDLDAYEMDSTIEAIEAAGLKVKP